MEKTTKKINTANVPDFDPPARHRLPFPLKVMKDLLPEIPKDLFNKKHPRKGVWR